MQAGVSIAAAVLLSWGVAGLAFGSETIRNIPPAAHGAPAGSTLDAIAQAIEQAAGERQWYGGIERAGLTVVSTTIRTHRATVEIGFDEWNFWINYRDSSNLDYDPKDLTRFEAGGAARKIVVKKGPRIHGNYNLWVQDLAAHMASRIRTIITDEQGRDDQPSAVLIADELDKLDQLRQRGVLTQAEFDAQKAKLLAH